MWSYYEHISTFITIYHILGVIMPNILSFWILAAENENLNSQNSLINHAANYNGVSDDRMHGCNINQILESKEINKKKMMNYHIKRKIKKNQIKPNISPQNEIDNNDQNKEPQIYFVTTFSDTVEEENNIV